MKDRGSFIRRLVRQEYPRASPGEFDDLLQWLAGRTNDSAASVEAAFNAQGVPVETARRSTLGYLDRTMFEQPEDYYRLMGLSPGCSFAEIRGRHKQLLQTFHPDRHSHDCDWFTARTEQLNRAYSWLRKNHGRVVRNTPGPPPASRGTGRASPAGAAARAARPGRRASMAAYKVRLRRKLKAFIGNPARFERRFYFVLFSVPAVLFLIIYLSHLQAAAG